MRILGLLVLTLCFPLLASTELTTQIHDIDYGNHVGDEVLVLLKSGHVAKLGNVNAKILTQFKKSRPSHQWFTFTLNQKREITKVVEVDQPEQVVAPDESMYTPMNEKAEYVPTTIDSMATAKQLFREGRHSPKDSQCFNRALVWTYEWWRKHSLRSQKILIFFTRNYIRRYDFEWWFHIAPYVHVMENGAVVERVMDVKYTRGPIPFRKWTDIFMKQDTECPVITKYSEYADYPYTGECYIMRTHMYTYQPADLQMYDAWNYKKESFVMQEVQGAYLEAFNITYP